jgi:diacylglycerol kinase (ATP)
VKNAWALACGGDGTVGWVLHVIDSLNLPHPPPVAVIPLGTGNDLARTLQWGPGYAGEKLSGVLTNLLNAHEVKLDRWTISRAEKDASGNFGEYKHLHVLNNYFSLGIDAAIALQFHLEREAHPEKFTSRTGNKLVYGQFGAQEMIKEQVQLGNVISLEIEGKPFSFPKDIIGLMVINLPSYAGGSNFWGKSTEQPIAIDDRRLEIAGISSVLHLGNCKVGLATALRLAQTNEIVITFTGNSNLAVQNDGEPWSQTPCKLKISFLNQAKMLCAKDNILIP